MRSSEVLRGFAPLLGRLEEATGVPRAVLLATVIMLVGWGVALAVRALVRRLADRLHTMLPAGGQHELDEALGARRASGFAARAAFWLVLVIFFMAATEKLGLPLITTWLGGVASYAPRLVVAAVVVLGGVVVARLAGRALRQAAAAAGAARAARLGRLAQLVVLGVSVLVAIEQLGVDVRFVTTALLVTLAVALGAAGLAFALGSAGVVTNILGGHYLRQLYEVGQVVRIDGIEGRIVRVTATVVVLHTAEGEVAIPAGEFTRTRSVLISREGPS